MLSGSNATKDNEMRHSKHFSKEVSLLKPLCEDSPINHNNSNMAKKNLVSLTILNTLIINNLNI